MIVFGVYLLCNYWALLAQRLNASKAEPEQRWLLASFFPTFLALFIILGLEHHPNLAGARGQSAGLTSPYASNSRLNQADNLPTFQPRDIPASHRTFALETRT